MSADLTPDEALAAVLAGRTVRVVVGSDPDDPVCLHYLDRCYEDDYQPMIYSVSVGGWSEGVREAVCEPNDSFYVGWVADPPPLSLSITDETPLQRESPEPVVIKGGGDRMTDPIHLPKLISDEFEISTSEARRLLCQGAVRIDGTIHFGQCVPAESLAGKTLTVGKRRSVKL